MNTDSVLQQKLQRIADEANKLNELQKLGSSQAQQQLVQAEIEKKMQDMRAYIESNYPIPSTDILGIKQREQQMVNSITKKIPGYGQLGNLSNISGLLHGLYKKLDLAAKFHTIIDARIKMCETTYTNLLSRCSNYRPLSIPSLTSANSNLPPLNTTNPSVSELSGRCTQLQSTMQEKCPPAGSATDIAQPTSATDKAALATKQNACKTLTAEYPATPCGKLQDSVTKIANAQQQQERDMLQSQLNGQLGSLQGQINQQTTTLTTNLNTINQGMWSACDKVNDAYEKVCRVDYLDVAANHAPKPPLPTYITDTLSPTQLHDKCQELQNLMHSECGGAAQASGVCHSLTSDYSNSVCANFIAPAVNIGR